MGVQHRGVGVSPALAALRVSDHGARVSPVRAAVLSTQYSVLSTFLSVATFLSPAYVAAQAPSSSSLEVVIAGRPTRKTLTLTTTQPARVTALEQAPIHSKLSAYVAEVLVDYGDKVKKDDPLVKLAAPELDAELVQRRALIEQARAELHQAEAASRASEAAMQSARSRVVQAEAAISRNQADIERWKSEFARIEQLATSGSLNRQLVDETQQKYRFAEAGMKESQAAIDSARSLYGQSQAEAARATADIEAARARVRVAEANAAQTEALHSYLTMTAPFDGIVTHRNVDPGAFVQPVAGSAPPLVVVARADKMRVFVAVPEMEAAYVSIGDPLSLEVQSLRGAEFKGKVTRTGFALDPDSRSLETIADLDNPSLTLRPGLYGTVKIMLEEHANVLTLPAAAVVRQGKEAFCYKLVGGKAGKTPLKLGLKVGDDFEIAAGVTENDAVILNKASSLKDGQPVEVLKNEAKK